MTDTSDMDRRLPDRVFQALELAVKSFDHASSVSGAVSIEKEFLRSENRAFAEAAALTEQLRPEDLAFRVNSIQ